MIYPTETIHVNIDTMLDFNTEHTGSDDTEIETVLKAIDDRYAATKNIRERVQNTCFSVFGLFVIAAGYVLSSTNGIATFLKISVTVMTVLSVTMLRLLYLNTIECRCKTAQQHQVTLGRALGVYADESLYPVSWLYPGAKKDMFFQRNYLLLYAGMVSLLVCLWIR